MDWAKTIPKDKNPAEYGPSYETLFCEDGRCATKVLMQ
jgi:hypothetical protein